VSSVAFVLAQVDAGQAISVAKDLGASNAQTILAFIAVALAIGFGWAIWKLISEIKSCGAERTELFGKHLEASNRMSDALDGNSQVMKAALEALKK
jgi:UDP-N-acetylmuramyl pentapeptide synthase